MTTLHWIDYAIMGLYFAFVLGIGAMLRRYVHTSEDFFLSGRSIPAWVTGLAFISANLGAQEVIGMGASGAKYGIATSHFYWVGAIPAMVFVGLFMMPCYYGSRARSVPEYLKLRFDEKTRAVNAVSFAVMTVFSSGISLYAMGKLLNLLLGWSFDASILVAGGIVLGYIFLGGLTSAIYNEVLQFFLIVFGFAPLVFLGLRDVGGWAGLSARLAGVATDNGFAAGAYTRSWAFMGSASANPVGVEWFGLVMGLGFVLSCGYWCTDFLLGLGLTALLASFMSGMAGNVTAFNTVWTYDLYQSYIRKGAPDSHYLAMGRFATVFGVAVSIAAAYVAASFNNIMDFLQLVFAFVNAPLFATFALGMFWPRATGHGAFTGLVSGILAAAVHHGISLPAGAHVGVKGGYLGVVTTYPSELAQTFWTAIAAWVTCFVVTIVVSLLTRPRPAEQLHGLVYGLTPQPTDDVKRWYERPS